MKSANTKLILIVGISVAVVSLIYLFVSNSLDSQEITEDVHVERTVESQNVYAKQIFDKCRNDAHCAVEALGEMAKTEDESTVLEAYDSLVTMFYETENYCHEQAHHLSQFLYAYTDNLTKAISHADLKCGGASLHGLIETHLFWKTFNNTNPDEIDVKIICPTYTENPYALKRYECLHGIGHGLMISYRNDVFSAVKRCDEFELEWELMSCSNGVFMQNVVNYSKNNKGIFDENDLLYPCNAVDSKYAPACYNYHASYILFKDSFSMKDSFGDCDAITPEEFVQYCYRGMGRHLLLVAYENMEQAIEACQVGQEQYHMYCLRGLVIGVTDQMGTDKGFQICGLLPNQFKEDCYDRIGKWIIMLYSDTQEKAKECSKAENSEYIEICMKANLEDLTLL